MNVLSLREGSVGLETPDAPQREYAPDFAPVIGQFATLRRIVRPQSYYRAMTELIDVPKWQRIRSRLGEYSERNGDFFFVQIGANDGMEVDPIREQVLDANWNGLLVEPVPYLFKRLKENYNGRDGLSFANVAVTDHDGSATMLAAVELDGEANNPARLISSLDPGVVHKHRWLLGPLDGLVRPTEVEAMTLPSLVQSHGIERIDGLFVDTEGHDKVVLDQIDDLPTGLPTFILYEHTHLSSSDRQYLSAKLEDNGYDLTDMRKDTFAELPADL